MKSIRLFFSDGRNILYLALSSFALLNWISAFDMHALYGWHYAIGMYLASGALILFIFMTKHRWREKVWLNFLSWLFVSFGIALLMYLDSFFLGIQTMVRSRGFWILCCIGIGLYNLFKLEAEQQF